MYAGRLAPLLTTKLPPALPKSKPCPPPLTSRPAARPPVPTEASAVAPTVLDDASTAASVRDCQAVIRRLQAENQRQAVEVSISSVFSGGSRLSWLEAGAAAVAYMGWL